MVLFFALFIFFCFLLYFLILFAFSFRKIINFLLVPLVFKFEQFKFEFFEICMNLMFVINFTSAIKFSPGWWHDPGLKVALWSRFRPPTGTNGGGPGARPIGPGSSHQPGPKGPDEPGPMSPRGLADLLASRTGTNGPMGPGS